MIFVRPTNEVVEAGNDISLRCVYDSATVTAVWNRPGSLSIGTTIGSVTTLILTIHNATVSDAGSYTCTLSDSTESVKLIYNITVEGNTLLISLFLCLLYITVPPIVTINPAVINSQENNDTIENFSCHAYSIPATKAQDIVWYHNDIIINSSAVTTTTNVEHVTYSVLSLSTMRSSNGTYHCSASNVLASRNSKRAVASSTKAIFNILCKFLQFV